MYKFNQRFLWIVAVAAAACGPDEPESASSSAIQPYLDTDGDGLSDGVETNTGRYLGPWDTGTNPFNPDTDGDSLLDGEEVDGLPGLPLPQYGVSPVRRDVLVEMDWLIIPGQCDARPTSEFLRLVSRTFRDKHSTLVNPDGSFGINVIIDYGQFPTSGGNSIPATVPFSGAEYSDPAFLANFSQNRVGYFRWAIATPLATGLSGAAYGNYFFGVACDSNPFGSAAVFGHELGHSLGLSHGGPSRWHGSAFECTYKPNYNSIMGYRFVYGIDTNCDGISNGDTLRFSTGSRIQLNELELSDVNGVCGPGFPIDWNGDGFNKALYSFDVNPQDNYPGCAGLTTLRDWNDWDLMRIDLIKLGGYPFPTMAGEAQVSHPETVCPL